MVSETDGRIDEVGQRLLADIGKLRRLEVSILEAEILRRLTDGRKTAFELIDAIYGLRRGDKGFNSARLKVRRALRGLERRGFVSTNLFGREKPYRLTRYGVAVLSSILPEMDRPGIITLREIAVLVATTICGLALFGYVSLPESPGWEPALLLYAAFFTLFGISLTYCIRIIRRVV